jgi:16S rRNA U1498 N3-methylase RsmE
MTDAAVVKSTSPNLLIDIGDASDLILPQRPTIDLILGIPRPRLLPNILSTIACLGVRRLFLLKSAKVDRNYMSLVPFIRCLSSSR